MSTIPTLAMSVSYLLPPAVVCCDEIYMYKLVGGRDGEDLPTSLFSVLLITLSTAKGQFKSMLFTSLHWY